MGEDKEVSVFLDSMELSIDDAWTLFKLLANHETNAIDIEEFVDGILRLRGVAKSVDMAKLMNEMKWMLKSVQNLANYLHLELARIRDINFATTPTMVTEVWPKEVLSAEQKNCRHTNEF